MILVGALGGEFRRRFFRFGRLEEIWRESPAPAAPEGRPALDAVTHLAPVTIARICHKSSRLDSFRKRPRFAPVQTLLMALSATDSSPSTAREPGATRRRAAAIRTSLSKYRSQSAAPRPDHRPSGNRSIG